MMHFVENNFYYPTLYIYLTTHLLNILTMKTFISKSVLLKKIGLNVAAVTYIITNIQTMIKL